MVFVQNDNPSGNQVIADDRRDNGNLTLARADDTGGLGRVFNGAVVDHRARRVREAADAGTGRTTPSDTTWPRRVDRALDLTRPGSDNRLLYYEL